MWQKIKSSLFHNKNTKQTIAKNAFYLTVYNTAGGTLRAILIVY